MSRRDMLAVIKLGGSAITIKDEIFTPNTRVIENIAEQLLETWRDGWKLILVHGGGSYGHPIAKKYRVMEGYKSPRSMLGYLETRMAMLKLNELLARTFVSKGLPVVPLHTACISVAESGLILNFYYTSIETALRNNFIPLLEGDVVLDAERGFSIVSGDQVVYWLARKFKPKKVIFGIDVKGIYNRDPKKHKDAVLLKRISIEELRRVSLGKAYGIDVTGGIQSKMEYIIKIVEGGIPVYVGSLLDPRVLVQMVRGEEGQYTIIWPAPRRE